MLLLGGMNKLNIILSGGGNEEQTHILDHFFLSKIPQNGSILYVPIALRGHELFSGAESWFKSVLAKHNRKDILVTTMNDFQDVRLFEKNHDAIYIGGGNTWLLLGELQKSGRLENLKELALSGTLVYGGSAGAIILGNDISQNPDEKTVDPIDTSGLDLLSEFSVVPHSDVYTKQDRRAYQKTIALPEDSGVHVLGGEVRVISGEIEINTPAAEVVYTQGQEFFLDEYLR